MYIHYVLKKITNVLGINISKLSQEKQPVFLQKLHIIKHRIEIRSKIKRTKLVEKINKFKKELLFNILQVIDTLKNSFTEI